MNLKVALAQINIAFGDPDANLEKAHLLAAEAARRGCDLFVLPELWSTGYDLERASELASPLDGGIFAAMSALAEQHRLTIVGSALSNMGEGRVGNTAVLFDGEGKLLARYSKVHLFRLMDEDRYLTAGDTLTLAPSPWGPLGLAICYDLRFPEMFRRYAVGGARIMLLPSEWPHPRLAHWQTLLRARAIENQCFVVACNRVGLAQGSEFFGHSCIIDPWGEAIIEGGEAEMLLSAHIDTARVDAVRAEIPILDDRRPDLYGDHLPPSA